MAASILGLEEIRLNLTIIACHRMVWSCLLSRSVLRIPPYSTSAFSLTVVVVPPRLYHGSPLFSHPRKIHWLLSYLSRYPVCLNLLLDVIIHPCHPASACQAPPGVAIARPPATKLVSNRRI
ncbi:hypothetical protein BDQ94DRAFT_64740 [Aspergillus welwitschiae]|uniref:Uncharacterized protein n=1 Tax=Aspergillus welwitschiae TaxID=1341132 RepID=A0A3F3PWV3_9EURO|nr:hypothetical protein BDQ94DRAFT_64740 [Aspergillus welwitschiae]RDH30796.1 hypothetical protein BDQ94DRAFT_64740 [Aspergillus welwitschiae]